MMCITQSVSEPMVLGARRIDRDSGRLEAKLGAEWGSVREIKHSELVLDS
jgi:hypothetical protein